ncbi:hypothetical protein [Saccharomonospora viridis]|uniref:hypothetical protein n=1 Tax=Saccharomonospora viridis TaxID=1852 RepID=UPI0024093158|nr:hypothetical protein [Saccharomonospora viridis]
MVELSEDECRRRALDAINDLIELKEKPDMLELSDEIGNYLFLLGKGSLLVDSEAHELNPDELREIADKLKQN